ncbi:MAG: FAD-containing oxidoreductase, partial [bacterium]|nr:FAD-containing oxidoreductase [bacterium]
GDEEGFVKIHVKRGSDTILGATIVARHAGEMISQVTLAMVGKVGLKTLSNVIHPYPTQAEAIRQAADAYQRGRLTPRLKRFLSRWLTWRR